MKPLHERLDKYLYENKISNEELVQIIEVVGTYLNLQTISGYARHKNMSYNGVKKCRKTINLFGVKFVIDNH